MPTYDDDPYLAPLHQQVDAIAQGIQDLQRRQQAERQQQQAELQQQWQAHWLRQLGALRQAHPEINAEAVVRFASAEGLRDMTQAYKLMHFEDTLKAAEQRGMERARAQGSPPRIVPHAQAAAPTSPASSMGDALREAIADPDVQASLAGFSRPDLPHGRVRKDVPSYGGGM